jgi:hypothetical protein
VLKFLQKIVTLLVATAYVAVMFFCLNVSSLEHNSAQASCCTPVSEHSTDSEHHGTHALEHLQHWQTIFASSLGANSNLLLNILFILATLGVFVLSPLKFGWADQFLHFDSRLNKLRNINAKLFDVILQAISRGILNPKLYNSFTLVS